MVRSEYKMNKTNSRTTEYSIRHRPINAIISPPVSRNRRYVKRIGRIRSHFHFNCKSYMNSSMNWKASISLSLSLFIWRNPPTSTEKNTIGMEREYRHPIQPIKWIPNWISSHPRILHREKEKKSWSKCVRHFALEMPYISCLSLSLLFFASHRRRCESRICHVQKCIIFAQFSIYIRYVVLFTVNGRPPTFSLLKHFHFSCSLRCDFELKQFMDIWMYCSAGEMRSESFSKHFVCFVGGDLR